MTSHMRLNGLSNTSLHQAHNHVIYTNQKTLLYGDFYIDMKPDDNLLCTAIQLGSPDFKTWEEVITYFSRLS